MMDFKSDILRFTFFGRNMPLRLETMNKKNAILKTIGCSLDTEVSKEI